MCIMEVRDGQRTSTIAQAMAHNTSTIQRDMEMFRKLAKARGCSQDVLDLIDSADTNLMSAYRQLLDLFGDYVELEVNPDIHVHDHENGHERTFLEQAEKDIRLGRRYMTR